MRETVPLLSRFLPLQLYLKTARAIGLGFPALYRVLRKIQAQLDETAVFADYEPTEHDVFATCFSKSGTNWTLQLIVQIAHLGRAEFRHIHEIAAWPQAPFPGIVALADPGPWLATPTGLRAIKTSLRADQVPYSPRANYLCVARDPKEIYVSAYYFFPRVFGMNRHIAHETWFEAAMQPDSFIKNWPMHMAGFWAWRDRPNVQVLFFPDMKRDLPGTVDRVAALLGVTLDDDQRAEVIRKSGFKYMKSNESCFAPPRMPLLTGKARGKMLRSGESGQSSELLTKAQRDEIDQSMLAGLRALGSDFPYAEWFMGG